MTEDQKFTFGQFKRFCRSVVISVHSLKIWMWVSINRMDWTKSIDLGSSASRGQDKCVEKEKDQTRDNLEGYKIQGEEEEPSMRSEIQLER